MKPRAVILRDVCRRLYALGIGRNLVRLLNRVYARLETDVENLRHNRVPGREHRFWLRHTFV